MSKSPAFQFYPGDFLVGTMGMTNEEVGIYIKMLCIDWEKDGIENTGSICRMLRCRANKLEVPLSKFVLQDDNRYRNLRLLSEREKQGERKRKMADNAKLGWKKGKDGMQRHSNGNANAKQKQCSLSSSPSTSSNTTPQPPKGGKGEGDLSGQWKKVIQTYPGGQRAADTEFAHFQVHPDWFVCLPLLLPAIENQIQHNEDRLLSDGFDMKWKSLANWISSRDWEYQPSPERPPPSKEQLAEWKAAEARRDTKRGLTTLGEALP